MLEKYFGTSSLMFVLELHPFLPWLGTFLGSCFGEACFKEAAIFSASIDLLFGLGDLRVLKQKFT